MVLLSGRHTCHVCFVNKAQMWDICIALMWDATYLRGLDRLRQAEGIETVLDCAGGTGFPSIALKKMGWNITYSDASEEMQSHFRQRAQQQGVEMPVFFSNWRDLSKNILRQFDAVMCRGNSLIYVDSWDSDQVSDAARDQIRNALREFRQMIKPGGVLYVDTTHRSEFEHASYPFREEFPERLIQGKSTTMTWEVNHDPDAGRRTIDIEVTTDGNHEYFGLYSHLLPPSQLAVMLVEAGFARVEEVAIEGEANYTVFLAFKGID